MLKRTSIFAVALTLAAACAPSQKPSPAAAPQAQPSEAFRAQPPPPGPQPEFEAPVPTRETLQNGLTLLVDHKPALPLVNVTVVVRSGGADDPAELPGLAGFVGDMLRAGTKTRSAEQIASEIETQGANLQISVDEDATILSVTALESNLPAVFDVLADVVQHPAFAPDEIERVRRRRLAAIAQEMDDPARLASRVFREVIFGAHPYGHTVLGTPEALSRIQRRDLVRFYERHLRPANAAVLVVGSLEPQQAMQAVRDRLGGWSGPAGVSEPPPPAEETGGGVVLVGKPGAPQSQLRVGQIGVERASPDFYALVVANAILGGTFNSRINMNLREDKGYTYGAYSTFEFMRSPGPFYVATAVETTVTAASITEIISEIDAIRATGVTAEELTNAKNRYILSLPGLFQTAGAVASMLANIYVYDLSLDYYRQLPRRIEAVTAADVQRVMREHLEPENLDVVVVGDPARVRQQLEALGRGDVRVRDAGIFEQGETKD